MQALTHICLQVQWATEDTLQSIPEDSTLDSMSTGTITSDSEMGTKIDPKLLKLQQQIRRQREKHEHEVIIRYNFIQAKRVSVKIAFNILEALLREKKMLTLKYLLA